MRKTKEEAEATRERLLDAALVVFNRKGYAGTTLNDIAAEAGVTRGAIYWHFSGKPELYGALVQERYTPVNTLMAEIFMDDSLPVDKLRRLMSIAIEQVEKDEQFRAILEITQLRTEVTEEMEAIMPAKYEATKAILDGITGIIENGKAMGQFRSNLDSKSAAIAAVSLSGGVISLWMTTPGYFELKDHAGNIIDTFIRGIVK